MKKPLIASAYSRYPEKGCKHSQYHHGTAHDIQPGNIVVWNLQVDQVDHSPYHYASDDTNQHPYRHFVAFTHWSILSRSCVALVYNNAEKRGIPKCAEIEATHLGTSLLIGAQILTLAQPYELAKGSMDEQ